MFFELFGREDKLTLWLGRTGSVGILAEGVNRQTAFDFLRLIAPFGKEQHPSAEPSHAGPTGLVHGSFGPRDGHRARLTDVRVFPGNPLFQVETLTTRDRQADQGNREQAQRTPALSFFEKQASAFIVMCEAADHASACHGLRAKDGIQVRRELRAAVLL